MRELLERLGGLAEGGDAKSWANEFVKSMNKKFKDGGFKLNSMNDGGKIIVGYNKPELRRTKLMKKYIESEFGLGDFDVVHQMENDGGKSVYTLAISLEKLKKKVLGEGYDPAVEAYNLITSGAELEGMLSDKGKDLFKAIKKANSQVVNLKKVGSHYISAPAILKGVVLPKMKAYADMLNEALKVAEKASKGSKG